MRMKNIMRTGAVAVVFLTAIIGVVFNSKAALATTSADSTFSQVIREIDCSHTVYSRAVGQVNDVECDVFAPKYDHSVIKDNGYPVIYGVYDAVHTVIDPVTGAHQLAIEFAGRVFVLGVDPELTVNGNAWVLDLSNWPNTHPGDTTLVIERGKTYLGEITSSTTASTKCDFFLVMRTVTVSPGSPPHTKHLRPSASVPSACPPPTIFSSVSVSKICRLIKSYYNRLEITLWHAAKPAVLHIAASAAGGAI